MKNLGIYIHMPFCKHKCYYCDFISFAKKDELIEIYIEKLKQEILQTVVDIKKEYKVKTIYFGGGTPSYIDSKYIVEILKIINEKYDVDKEAEITIEINPGTVNKEKLQTYYNIGINRLSIGLQETNDTLLKQIGRIHNYEEFSNSYNLARQIGFKNINVDLMLGLPGQTINGLEKTVDNIIKINPEHISIYSLIVEKETKLEKMINNKELNLPNEETERTMYWNIKKQLEKNRFIHYEISNFAKRGYESKHNVACWNQEEYLGFGLAAHSYINNVRYCNTDNIKKYIEEKEVKHIIQETQNREIKMKEYMLLGLRKINGVKISKFKLKFVDNPIYIYRESLSKLVMQGLIKIDIDNIKLTNKGIDLANLVWEEFV